MALRRSELLAQIKDELLKALQDGPMTLVELRAATGRPHLYVLWACRRLMDDGKVTRQKVGRTYRYEAIGSD